MDCVERKAVIDLINVSTFDLYDSDENWIMQDRVWELPSVQPEIIRCKDCKQFRRWIDTDTCFCDITEAEVSDNDFCSKAEKEV